MAEHSACTFALLPFLYFILAWKLTIYYGIFGLESYNLSSNFDLETGQFADFGLEVNLNSLVPRVRKVKFTN